MRDIKATIDLIRRRAKESYGVDAKDIGIVGAFGLDSKVDVAKREITWIANTSDIDLEDEVVVPEGLDGSRYFFRNRTIFVDHDYAFDKAIGKMRSAKLTQLASGASAWRVHAYIAKTALGNDVLTFADEAGGIGSSIGFMPVDYGKPTGEEKKRYAQGEREPRSIVRKSHWLELSATAIPMNVSCQGHVIKTDERAAATLDTLLTKSRISRESAVAMGFTPAKKRVIISVPRRTVVFALNNP